MKKQYLFFIRLVIVFALVIFGISKVSATITFNNSADGGGYINSTTNTYALTIGNGINRLLVVQAWSAATGAGHITGITYNGIALTKIAEELESGQSCYVSLWYLLSPASGTNNIEVTTDVSGIISTAASYTGVRQFGQPDASVGNHGLRPQTFTLTTATDNSWTVIGIRCLSGSPTAVTGATLRQSTAAGAGIFDSNGPTTPAGSTSMTISNTSNNQVSGVMASFAPAHSVFFSSECTGGIKTHYGGNTIHTFTSSGTLVCTGTGTVRVLVVAGGGGTSGADNTSGGGGAGGLIENFAYSASGNISVTIGNGGTGQTNGQNSLFGSLTAIGGGYGARESIRGGASGGSGGGATNTNDVGGSAISGQGNAGGNSPAGNNAYPAGGGGGAGAAGQTPANNTSNGGNGGIGVSTNISGIATYYAGGGGGDAWIGI